MTIHFPVTFIVPSALHPLLMALMFFTNYSFVIASTSISVNEDSNHFPFPYKTYQNKNLTILDLNVNMYILFQSCRTDKGVGLPEAGELSRH